MYQQFHILDSITMKKLVTFIILLSFPVYIAYSQDFEKVDSLFNNHLKSLKDTIDKNTTSNEMQMYIYGRDATFLYVLSEISDFKFEQHGYTHQPMLNKIEWYDIKEWYKEYRKKLNWFKIYNLFRIYEDYNNAYKIIKNDDPATYKLYLRTLDSLEVEHSRLRSIDTFTRPHGYAE